MVVLALETATRAGSHAVWIDGALDASRGDPARTHGERLPADLVALLARGDRTLADVDLFAVVAGPGSFTGLRVGMATVQGLALPLGRRVVPVPTMDAMAAAWIDADPGEAAVLALCLDGQRGDVFWATVDRTETRLGAGDAPSPAPAVGRPDDAAADIVRRAHGRAVAVVGSGAARHADVFRRRLPSADIADLDLPLAAAAARLAARHPDRAVAADALRPIYVRRPDAELARDRARGLAPASDLPPGWTLTRAGGTDDLGAVEALQRRAFVNAWGAESIRWELEHTDVARLYLLRDPERALVAYCACWMVFDELHINSLAVDEGWRRRGLARAMLRAVFREAVAAGARSATLEVRQSNAAARALYEGLGFQVEGVRRDYYQNPREDALVLWHRRL
jgi:tRNA threonylcarbamoyl adenosine modification protein YeaZ/ribosomal-protein-alanine acetyltransferase